MSINSPQKLKGTIQAQGSMSGHIAIKEIIKGKDGVDGKTPVKGVDYFTPTEIQEIAGQAARMVEVPEGGGSSPAIIDVTELPVESINVNAFYRLLSGSLVYNQTVQTGYTCYCVDELPETGEPATNIDNTHGNIYFNLQDNEVYGYVDTMLSAALGVPAGWYLGSMLLGALGLEYKGFITNIAEDPGDNAFRFLLERVVYHYKDRWISIKTIGLSGDGLASERFNSAANIAHGMCSHAEGWKTIASGDYSHAEGSDSHAQGRSSHAEGSDSHAEGDFSHAEGYYSHAEGYCSHAEGTHSHAYGSYSHAEGFYTIASGVSSHVQGKFNITDTDGKYAHIVGNGTDDRSRSNAHTLDWDGNAWFAGFVEGTGLILKSPNGKQFMVTVDDSGNLTTAEVTQ